jgi:RNA polymerase sigma-70 factor (ECF subfamily)
VETSDENPKRNEVQHSEAVLRLFTKHQRWLHGYLMSLLGSANDVEDVMQEVSVVMWQQHEKFQLGTNFVSWISVIAYHQVQKFWRDKKKRKRFLSVATTEQLADKMTEDFEFWETRRQALSDCISMLGASDRQLVSYCYGDKALSMKSAARELNRPVGSVYKAMGRIRRSLFQCISRKMAAEGMFK